MVLKVNETGSRAENANDLIEIEGFKQTTKIQHF